MTVLRGFLSLTAAIYCSGAFAQEVDRTKEFAFTSGSTDAATRTERFCLSRDENLIEVKRVSVAESNTPASVDVKPDPSANCFDVVVQLPPATNVCTEIPKIKNALLATVTVERQCASVPTIINFAVTYSTRRASLKGGALNRDSLGDVSTGTTGSK